MTTLSRRLRTRGKVQIVTIINVFWNKHLWIRRARYSKRANGVVDMTNPSIRPEKSCTIGTSLVIVAELNACELIGS